MSGEGQAQRSSSVTLSRVLAPEGKGEIFAKGVHGISRSGRRD